MTEMEIYKIANEQFEVGITSIGAEICSFKSKKSGKEYMWQGNPEIWGSHAPVLFPIVGGLKEDTYIFEGEKYNLPRHGFIRKNKDLKIITQTTNQLVLQLDSGEKTKLVYPFDFRFQICFELLSNQLKITHKVFNTGEKEMYFSLGAHPAFNCPLEEGEKYEDYHLQFAQTEKLNTWVLDENGQIKEEGAQIMNQTDRLQLHLLLFEKDALIFKSLKSRRVSLCKQDQEVVRVDFDDFRSLGLWAKPKAPFICIEPWLGYADSSHSNQQLTDKQGIIKLKSQKEYTSSYTISIIEK